METIWLYQFCLIVVGDSIVGKLCLIRRFTEGRFAQVSDPTVGVDFFSRLVESDPGKRIKLQIWDTAGQERFRSITRTYYRNSVGGLLLFNKKRPKRPQLVGGGPKPCLASHHCVSAGHRQEAEKLVGTFRMCYVETSVLDAINVEKAFVDLTRDIFLLIQSGDIKIQNGWEGVKSGFVPNIIHSSEEVSKGNHQCLC
uniref:RAB39B, member RAS onco family n=1 Tax=Takifugu rubripes TaxID=31033 RepID=H2TJT9_TAKRU